MMLVIAIIIGIAAFAGTWYGMSDFGIDGVFDFIMITLASLLATAISGSAMFFGGAGIANLTLSHHDHYERLQLVAIRDGTGIDGAFVWGSGAIGSTGNYMFYYREGNAVRLANIDGSSVALFQDSHDAYAIEFTGCTLSWDWLAPCFSQDGQVNEIHVPKGTVKTKINLGLNP